MSKLEDFMAKPLGTPKDFCLGFMSAAREIRMEELGVDITTLLGDGDVPGILKINESSLRPVQAVFPLTGDTRLEDYSYIPLYLNKITENWQIKKEATVWRGTRLPSNAGSFDMEGIHTTVQLNIASGYAGGLANSSTGVGRLLNHAELGFVTGYQTSLETPTWKNFQYEDYQAGKTDSSSTTLEDLRQSMKKLTEHKASDFYLDSEDIASPALKEWYELAHNRAHYEVILPESHPVSETYLRTKKGFIAIDPHNPKWDSLLARVQEASLRDFYEIRPLEKAREDIKHANIDSTLAEKLDQHIEQEMQHRSNAPWTLNSMKDIAQWQAEHVRKSTCVGSAMEQCDVHYDSGITQILEAVDNVLSGNTLVAEKLLENNSAHVMTFNQNNKVNQVNSQIMKIREQALTHHRKHKMS